MARFREAEDVRSGGKPELFDLVDLLVNGPDVELVGFGIGVATQARTNQR